MSKTIVGAARVFTVDSRPTFAANTCTIHTLTVSRTSSQASAFLALVALIAREALARSLITTTTAVAVVGTSHICTVQSDESTAADASAFHADSVSTARLTVETESAVELPAIFASVSSVAFALSLDYIAPSSSRTEIGTLSRIACNSNPSSNAIADSIHANPILASITKLQCTVWTSVTGKASASAVGNIADSVVAAVTRAAGFVAFESFFVRRALACFGMGIPGSLAIREEVANGTFPAWITEASRVDAFAVPATIFTRSDFTGITRPSSLTLADTMVVIAFAVSTFVLAEKKSTVRTSEWIHAHACVVFADTAFVAFVWAGGCCWCVL